MKNTHDMEKIQCIFIRDNAFVDYPEREDLLEEWNRISQILIDSRLITSIRNRCSTVKTVRKAHTAFKKILSSSYKSLLYLQIDKLVPQRIFSCFLYYSSIYLYLPFFQFRAVLDDFLYIFACFPNFLLVQSDHKKRFI